MSARTQQNPFLITGSTVADLPNPANMPEGYVFRAHSGQAFALEIDPATGTRSWQVFQSSGGSTGTLPKYWVNNSPPAPGEIPTALYTDIQAGIDAAFADGHNPTNPADVLVLSGAYSQTAGAALTMRAGINVIGVGGFQQLGSSVVSDVQFTGDVIVDLASGVATIQGISVIGTLRMIGVSRYVLAVNNSQFVPSTGDGFSYSNSGGALPIFTNSLFVSGGGGGRGADLSVSAQASFTACTFSGNGAGPAIQFQWDAGQSFLGCRFDGLVSGLAGGSGTAEFDDCIFNPSSTAVMQVTGGATADVLRGKIIGSPTDPFFSATGAGATLLINDVIVPSGTHISISTSNLRSSPNYKFHGYSESTIGGASPVTLPAFAMTDIVLVSPAGAWSITLPPIASVITGLRVTITNTNAAPAAATLIPNGTDTVNGVNANYITAGNARSVTLQTRTNSGVTDWRIVSISPL